MTGIPSDVRPASAVVKEAADCLMVRWTERGLGGGSEAGDARVLRCLNRLDEIADELAEIEVLPPPPPSVRGALKDLIRVLISTRAI